MQAGNTRKASIYNYFCTLVVILIRTSYADEYDEYIQNWNVSEGVDSRGIVYTSAGAGHSYGYPDGDYDKPRVWSVKMEEPGATRPPERGAASTTAPGGVIRRFPTLTQGRQAKLGDQTGGKKSCPGGVCPNPDLDGAPLSPDAGYDLHYDPRFPYDNCHYIGGFNQFRINGSETCHLLVRGVDGHADRLPGGMDGLFLLAGCFQGKPMYIRSRSSGPPGEDRVLYYNPHFGSWEFAVGKEPNADQLVLAGDEGYVSPIDVPHWHLGAVFNSDQAALLPSDDEELYYIAAGISVMCADEGDDRLLVSPAALAEAAEAAVAAAAAGEGRGGAAGGSAAGRGGKGGGSGSAGGKGAAEGAPEGSGGGRARGPGRGVGRGRGGGKGGEGGDGGGGGSSGGGGGERPAGGRATGAKLGVEERRPGSDDDDGEEEASERGGHGAAVGGDAGQGRSTGREGRRAGGGSGDSDRSRQPSKEDLDQEVRELREYWQQHEEEYYEMRDTYGEYDPGLVYGDENGGPGYDEEYGYGFY